MVFPGTMAGFATYIQHIIGSVVNIRLHIIALLKIGAMAFCTHGIPVLCIAGPVQPVAVMNLLTGILVKPFFIAAIPALPGCLHLTSREFHGYC